MKSEYFRSKPSKIRGTREKAVEESINWDRVVYLSIIGFVLIALSYFLFDYYMIIEGQGRVVANRVEVRFPVDVRVTEMFVEEGDSARANEPLFSFAVIHQSQSPEKSRDERRRLEEKIMDVQGDIDQGKISYENAVEQLEYYKNQKELVQKEIRLGVSTLNDLRRIENKIMGLKQDTSLASSKLKHLRQQKARLANWRKAPEIYNTFTGLEMEGEVNIEQTAGNTPPIRKFTTSSGGVIETIDKNVSELAMRSESILTIKRKSKDIFIRAIFQQSSRQYLQNGDTLKVNFDGDIDSRGIVTGFDTPQLSNWQSLAIGELGNINKYVVVKLKPVDEEAFSVWEENSNVGVTIRKVIL
jgi:multidrug resistance efflux pump